MRKFFPFELISLFEILGQIQNYYQPKLIKLISKTKEKCLRNRGGGWCAIERLPRLSTRPPSFLEMTGTSGPRPPSLIPR